PRGGCVALRGKQTGDIDFACQSKTEQVGYQETWTKESMDKGDNGRFAGNERAAPDRLIALKESLEINARHRPAGQKQRSQMKHDFPPRNHQRGGNSVPIDAKAADDIR